MKNLFISIVVSILTFQFAKAQEIIPFPDLSESHIAIYNQPDIIDNHNYSLYTIDYQEALKEMDIEIEEMNKKILSIEDNAEKKTLQNKAAELIKKRTALIQEAELLEDLNKFY